MIRNITHKKTLIKKSINEMERKEHKNKSLKMKK